MLELGSPSDASFQVLNTTSGSWLSAPSMTTARAKHACIAHAGHVWAFGGSNESSILNSIERISTRGDVTTHSFVAYSSTLLDSVINARAVGYSHRIYIIGGLLGSTPINTVQIIDTIQTTITRDILAYAVDATGGTFSHPFLYAFGGRTGTFPLDRFLSFDTTTSSPSKYPTQTPSKDPTAPPSKTPSDSPSQNPSVPTQAPSLLPSASPVPPPTTTGSPTQAPSLLPSTSPVTPSTSTMPPTRQPSGNPVANTSEISTLPPTITRVSSTVISKTIEATNGKENISFHISTDLSILIVIVSILAAVIAIACVFYLVFVSKISNRSKQIGTATIMLTLKEFSVIEKVSIGIEVIDVITDYLYAVDLITNGVALLGWISLFAALIGCVIFYVRFFLAKKLIGFQSARLRKEFKRNADNAQKCVLIMEELRQRRMDIDMISLLMACFEDCPQAAIVAIVVSSSIGWKPLSILSISLSITSFMTKICQVMMSKYGCKDPDDLHINPYQDTKKEVQLTEN